MIRSRRLKRAIDLVGTAVGLTFGAPLFATVAGLVWLDLGRPVVFRQSRSGLGGRPFEFLKFRTMHDIVDRDGSVRPDAERLTRTGRILRATSLDELPQLWNVLRGEMSLVGPRPHIAKYRDLYSAEQRRRLDVRPGITGWAQVNGRNQRDWETKFAHDVWYVDNWDLWLDLRILVRTITTVLRRQGIAHGRDVSMHEFTGTPGATFHGNPTTKS